MKKGCGLVFGAGIGLAAGVLSLAGCDDGGPTGSTTTGETTASTTTTAACGPAERLLEDGRCQPPGLPLDMPCAPGDTPLEDGTCQAPGVPPDACGDGFEADREGGCKPILPAKSCDDGLMAVPGEVACREVAPCGQGTWGDIPATASTQFVDSAYAGGDSDGSQDKPWTTVQEGIDAAEPGAIVAVAAGVYTGSLAIDAQPIHVWGRCPSMVSIEGDDAMTPAVAVSVSGGSIRGVSITGPGIGVRAGSEAELLLEQDRFHDTGGAGYFGEAGSAVTVKGCLFERVADAAIRAFRGKVDMEGTAIRDAVSGPTRPGHGIDVYGTSSDKATAAVRGSLIERAWGMAVNGIRAELTIERVAMRTTSPQIPKAAIPRGGVYADTGTLSLSQATIEGLYQGVIVSYSSGEIRHVTIDDGAPLPPGYALFKAGIYVQGDPPPKPATTAVIVESTIADQPQFGVAAIDATLQLTSCLVRGSGTEEGHDAAVKIQPGVLTMKHSAVLDSFHTGVIAVGGQASIESSLVRHVEPTADSGGCLTVRPPASGSGTASLTLVSSLIEGCTETGLASIESDVALSTSVFRDILPRPADGKFGDGIALLSKTPDRPPAKIDGCLVENAARAGISAFGRKVELGWSAVSCAAFSLAGEALEGVELGYEKTGDNACGCPAADGLCKIDSPGLAPPPEH